MCCATHSLHSCPGRERSRSPGGSCALPRPPTETAGSSRSRPQTQAWLPPHWQLQLATAAWMRRRRPRMEGQQSRGAACRRPSRCQHSRGSNCMIVGGTAAGPVRLGCLCCGIASAKVMQHAESAAPIIQLPATLELGPWPVTLSTLLLAFSPVVKPSHESAHRCKVSLCSHLGCARAACAAC